MSEAHQLRPRPPTRLVALNVIELNLLVAALDHSECTIRKEAPDEHRAHQGVQMLRRRLDLVRAQLGSAP